MCLYDPKLVSDQTYRVVQWATGSIGQIAIRHFAENPIFDLVGVYVTSDAKNGADAKARQDQVNKANHNQPKF